MVRGAASVFCRCSALVVAAAVVGRWETTLLVFAFLLGVAILITIRLAPSDSVRRELAVLVLGLTVLANPVARIDVGGGGNQIPGSDKSDAVVVELPRAALTEPHIWSLWRPAQATLIAGDLLSLRGGYISSL